MTAHHDLRSDQFPFELVALDSETGAVVWRHTVTGPGKVTIPPLARQLGRRVKMRIIWPDGTVSTDD
jgi:hypothetical protein